MHIVAHPFTIAEDISILFAITRKKILTQVSIKARRMIFTTQSIMIRSIRTITTIIPAIISPETTYITSINKVLNFLTGVIVSAKDTTSPLRIPVPM